jgi:cytochrome c biogenesis protein CcmG/thiol:disulfide interchange protein DsbE
MAGLSRDPHTIPSALIDRPAPEFALPPLTAAGTAGLASADFRGKVVLLNVFASWCIPCRSEHPILMRLAGDPRFTVYGIDYKDEPADGARFLSELGNPYKAVGADADGRVGIDWGVYGVPETFIIDRDGRIRHKQVGPITPQALQETILPLIGQLSK